MNNFVSKTLKAILAMVCIDVLGFITFCVFPDMTGPILYFLFLLLLLGIIGFTVAFFVWFPQRVELERLKEASGESKSSSAKPYKSLAVWILIGSASIFLLRSIVAIVRMPPNSWHTPQIFPQIEGVVAAAFLFYTAFRFRKSIKNKDSVRDEEPGGPKPSI